MHSPQVLFEDNHVLALVKPPGMLSQGDGTGDESAYDWGREYIRRTYNKPGNVYLGLLHRIDRPVGGLLLLAKTGKAAERLSAQFAQRGVQKAYLAITARAPSPTECRLEHYLAKLPGKNIVRAYNKPAYGAQLAQLDYALLATAPTGLALVRVAPITGRQHQIRVQLSTVGAVIAGDAKYGKTDFLPDKSIALWAWGLRLAHPTTQAPLVLTAPPPTTGVWAQFAANIPKEAF